MVRGAIFHLVVELFMGQFVRRERQGVGDGSMQLPWPRRAQDASFMEDAIGPEPYQGLGGRRHRGVRVAVRLGWWPRVDLRDGREVKPDVGPARG